MKYNGYIAFYDISKLQGAWGRVIRLTSFSTVTHVAPVIKVGDEYMTPVLMNGGKMRLTKIKHFQKLEIKLLHVLNVGAIDTSIEQILKDCDIYSTSTCWGVFWWYFFTRWFGAKEPKVCTTYACDLFKLPYKDSQTRVLPAALYRRLKNDRNYVGWQGPCW